MSGDRLRFKITTPRAGYLMIVGPSEQNEPFAVFPMDGSDVAQPVPAGEEILLPGAVELDDSVGTEVIVAIVCPKRFELTDLSWDDGKPAVPEGCRADSFKLVKKKAR